MVNRFDFFAKWKHESLAADFQRDGIPAASEPWLTEVTKIVLKGKTKAAILNNDNSMLAVGVDHDIHVYDLATFQLLHTLRGHAGYIVETLQFQPDSEGSKIAAGLTRRLLRSYESVIRVWDLEAPEQPLDYLDDAARDAASAASAILLQHWSVEDLASADLETQIAKVVAATQAAIDKRNGRILYGYLAHRAFSPDGRSFLYHSNHDVAVLDVDTLTERVRLSGHTNFIGWAETSPTNKVVATSSGDGTVRLWSMESGETRHVFKTDVYQSCSGAFSPDGELVAAGAGDGMVLIWQVDTGELLHTLAGGFRDRLQSLAFSPDGLHLAAGGSGGWLRVFNVKSEEREQSWQIAVEPDCAAFLDIAQVQYNSSGDLFFTSSEGRIFGYRASHNLKWDFFEPGHQDMLSTSGGVAILAGGSKLIAAFGSNVVVWKTD